MSNLELIASTAFGLESNVRYELKLLGYEARIIGSGKILFSGDPRAICRANLWLRCADRVLVRVASFRATSLMSLFLMLSAMISFYHDDGAMLPPRFARRFARAY